jgi:Replication initiator protein, pSAM2
MVVSSSRARALLTPEQVAGYLAKYATKAADDTGVAATPHHRRIRAITQTLAERAHAAAHGTDGDENPYDLLGKGVHMLGFRGHFASKSRRYSVTSAPSEEHAVEPKP